ncbi:hypothetical protein BH10PSE15_BH10PSE15_17250 [soil metagenome]
MNAHAPIDPIETKMTIEGQVLIPEALRDRAGLVPDGPVRIGLNDRGELVLSSVVPEETPEARRARIKASIRSVVGTVDFGFASTDEYMDFIRPYRLDEE